MKRIIAIVLLLAVFSGAAQAESYEDWLLDKTEQMLLNLETLIDDGAYRDMTGLSERFDGFRSGFTSTTPTRTLALSFASAYQFGVCYPMPEGFVPVLLLIDTGAEIGAILSVTRSGAGIVRVQIWPAPRAVFDRADEAK